MVFAVGICGFVTGSELLVRFVVAPGDGYERYKAEFSSAQAPIAAFGDSHVADGLESSKEFVNLGTASETLFLMLAKARSYAASGRGKKIVLQYAPEQFAIYRIANQQADIAEELLAGNMRWLEFMRPHFRGYLLAYWNAALRDPARIFAAFANSAPSTESEPQPADSSGLTALSPAEQRKAAQIRVQLHAPLPQGRIVEALVEKFAEVLREFRQKGIETCIVEYPLSSPYRESAAQAPTFEAMSKRFVRLAGAENVRFVDLAAAMPDSAFGNPDHIAAHARRTVTGLVLDGCFGADRSAAPR